MTSTIGMEVVPSPWVDLTNINFERGLAGEFTIDIRWQYVQIKPYCSIVYDKDEESISIVTRLLGPIDGHEELPAVEAEFLDEMNM